MAYCCEKKLLAEPSWLFVLNINLLKGNEALEIFFFFSSPRQGNMERKSKLKKN